MARIIPYPVFRWAGGKTKMVPHLMDLIPQKFGTYFEPFAGGAALFFELFRQKRFTKAVLGDQNPELMNAYRQIKLHVAVIIEELKKPVYDNNKQSYLEIRAWDVSKISDLERAARFIYLNRTGFNGLYRVNLSGGFNVPYGKLANPNICNAGNLRAVSSALKGVRLVEKHFAWVSKEAQAGDVVFFDPPYMPVGSTVGFTGYTPGGFGLDQHIELSMVFSKLADRGVTVLLSNSMAPEVRKLFRGFDIKELRGQWNIGGSAASRKPAGELLIHAHGVSSFALRSAIP